MGLGLQTVSVQSGWGFLHPAAAARRGQRAVGPQQHVARQEIQKRRPAKQKAAMGETGQPETQNVAVCKFKQPRRLQKHHPRPRPQVQVSKKRISYGSPVRVIKGKMGLQIAQDDPTQLLFTLLFGLVIR